MRHPNHVSKASDILFSAGELNRQKIETIIKDYEVEDGKIRQISYDGGPLGAWVNASIYRAKTEMCEYQWLYIAAGDHDNRLMVAQAADNN